MFGFFNKERDQKIERLEAIVKVLREWSMDFGNKTSSFIQKMQQDQDMIDDRMIDLDERLKKLEYLINMPSPQSRIDQAIDQSLTTTEAIIEFLNTCKKELHLDVIFDNMKNYNLKNKNVTKASFKSSVYHLASQGRIQYGEKAATFKTNP